MPVNGNYMDELILPTATITGLPRGLHENKVLKLKKINYFFGPNGSGKSLSLKNVTEQAKRAIREKGLNDNDYFAQYITATPKPDFYQDQFQQLDRRATTFDLENGEITGQAFYQHLQDYPEIAIKVRDALQKYLGRYPNVVKKGVYVAMNFLREEDLDVPGYSPQSESDGLKRLSLLLSYIYHPKCKFLAIDEPELFLHPDMISFLLQEVHDEIVYGKQFVFATHSPEMIKIGSNEIYEYSYFNLKNTLAETHIIQASDSNAGQIIEKLGYLLDVNRRAFLFAPTTLFVEGIADEVVYNYIREIGEVDWHRRIFMANTGGVTDMHDFWKLWNLFDKEVRVIIDHPKNDVATDSAVITINKFCNEFGIDESQSLADKIKDLKAHHVHVAPYRDVLDFSDKHIELKDFRGAAPTLDLLAHKTLLSEALHVDDPKGKQMRAIEEDWLISLAQEVVGVTMRNKNSGDLSPVKVTLQNDHPNIQLFDDPTSEYLLTIQFQVSRGRILFLRISSDIWKSKIGIL